MYKNVVKSTLIKNCQLCALEGSEIFTVSTVKNATLVTKLCGDFIRRSRQNLIR